MKQLYFITVFCVILVAGYGLLTEIAIANGSHNLIRSWMPEPIEQIDCGGQT